MAIKMNKPKYVNILYKYRADVNLIDKKTGRNSLHIAITEQATEIVKLLLEKTNIDILKEDFGGITPLKMAKHLMQDKERERIEIFNMIEKELVSTLFIYKYQRIKCDFITKYHLMALIKTK